MAQIIYPDGTRKEVSPKDGKTYELTEMQDIVGGYIEFAETTDGGMLVIDEEGKLKDKPFNGTATTLYKYNLNGRDWIAGVVLYIPQDELNTIA